jgi:hypothetical protein
MQFKIVAALSAFAGLMAAALPSHAVTVYSGPVSIAIPDTAQGLYLNVVTGVTNTTGSFAGYDINPYSAAAGLFSLWGPTANTWFNTAGVVAGPYPLAAGTSISGAAAAFFRPGGGTDIGTQVTLNAPNLFGFRFINEAAANQVQFGWVEITFGATAATRSITGYAYENSGAAILAGAVPEPGTYAMLLAGLATVGGIAARRRKDAASA